MFQIILFGSVAVGAFVYVVWAIKRRPPASIASRTWQTMPDWEKACLYSGTILYATVPMLSEHPAGGSYVAEVLLSIVGVLANALFIIGAIAFLKRAHDLERDETDSSD